MQFLARVMKDPNGFVTNAAFRAGTPSKPVIKTGEAFFNGNSQGGILGGAVTALSKEWTRAVLGVPAMNYSTLLMRSVDWDEFSAIMKQAYPDEIDQLVGLSLIQMLWDRGENNGYSARMTSNPLPGTPAHQIMLLEAFGDHQVTNVATEVQARSVPGHARVATGARAGPQHGRDADVGHPRSAVRSIRGQRARAVGLRHAGAADHEHPQPRPATIRTARAAGTRSCSRR